MAAHVLAVLCVAPVAACGTSTTTVPGPTPAYTHAGTSSLASSRPASVSAPGTRKVGPSPERSPSQRRPVSSDPTVTPAGGRPVIVVDPGHSPFISAVDSGTGLNVSDYENEPEMRDVFAVAELVRTKLEAAGYRVIMTKTSATARVSLGQRAVIANTAHAALALSIHDQAGSNGGLAFDQANNTVYYQSVGDYRATPTGNKVVFTDSRVAALSQKYGQIFRDQRAAVEGHPVVLRGNVGYDLGSRGLPAGNIWIVQLLSRVPWIYDEAGGNSAGMSGLNSTDKEKYADGLVAGVEHCISPAR